jgi:hypothetical protein
MPIMVVLLGVEGMRMMPRLVLLFATLAMACAPAMACAQYSGALGLSGLPNMSSFFGGNGIPSGSVISRQEGFNFTLGLRKYINSFTSRQFPDAPWSDNKNDPLSRLEYPWEQTFGVVKLGTIYRGIQVNFEGAATLFTDSGLKEQDSDWEDPHTIGQKTKFSEANDFPRCWTFDANIGYAIPALPAIQWLLGYRIQQFRFNMMDGVQYSLIDPPHIDYLHGEGSAFSQHYKISYLGAAIYSSLPYNLFARLSGDVGNVIANNVDNHIRRDEGKMYSYNSTRGICWHVDLALEYRVKEFASIGLVGDFMSITTRGGHRRVDPGVDESWDGAVVWSEQKYIEVNGTLIF